jgi:Cu/Ag efflux protein CusF
MLRICVCAVLALLLGAGVSLAGKGAKKGKKGHAVAGTVKKVDASAGTLTVTTKKKKVQEDQQLTVGDAAKIVVASGSDKKELSGKDGLKSIKEGDKVRVQADEAGNVVSLQVGALAKKGKKAKKANK